MSLKRKPEWNHHTVFYLVDFIKLEIHFRDSFKATRPEDVPT